MYYAEVGGTNIPARNSVANERVVPRQCSGRLRVARRRRSASPRRSPRPTTCPVPRPRSATRWTAAITGQQDAQEALDAANEDASSAVSVVRPRGRGSGGRTAPAGLRPSARARAGLVGYLFISPAILLFGVFIVGPFVYAIGLSFYAVGPVHAEAVRRARQLPRDDGTTRCCARRCATRSCSPSHRSSPTSSAASLLALGVNQLKNRYLSYFVRTSLFFPFVISWAAVALLWRYVLSPTVRPRVVLLRQARVHPSGLVQRPDNGRCRRSSASTGGTPSGSRS